ncbi:MAG TPA: hypothetical protein ENO33_03730 [Hydrogenobaculum sp.]|nr:hypothetical protein [Hydrogenobaculum sp.]
MKSYDAILSMYLNMLEEDDKNRKRISDRIYKDQALKGKNKNTIERKIKRELFKESTKSLDSQLVESPIYLPFFLNIGKEYEQGTEKDIYKDKFLKRRSEIKNFFNKSFDLMQSVINFDKELDSIKAIKTKWAVLRYEFELQEVYFSKDDTAFYVIDNPLKKDKTFKIPYIAPSTWKGMIRWVAIKHFKDKKASIKRLFGTQKGTEEETDASANLRIYPSFFNNIDLDLINPMDRKARKGTKPIYFEVIPKGTKSTLTLVYLPKLHEQQYFDEDVKVLEESVKLLIETYGISAKRSSGWGKAKIINEQRY